LTETIVSSACISLTKGGRNEGSTRAMARIRHKMEDSFNPFMIYLALKTSGISVIGGVKILHLAEVNSHGEIICLCQHLFGTSYD
jgi:hypothetical protein